MTTSVPTHAEGTRADSPLTPAMLALENATALDGLRSLGDKLSGAIVANDRVAALLQGRQAGHAMHPAVVQAPIGAWLGGLLLDLVGDDGDRNAARRLIGIGTLAAVPAALSGWAEYAGASPREKRVAVVHAAANGTGVLLQLGSWAARRSGRHGVGRVLAMGGMTAVGAGGYLGGHLATARRVGSRDAAFAATDEAHS